MPKKIFGKSDLVLFLIALAVAIITTISSHRPEGLLFNVSNFTFAMGMVYIIVGLSAVVKNMGGMFTSLSYLRYKRKFRRHGHADPSAKPLSYGDFLAEKTKNKVGLKKYFFVGLPLLAVSWLLAMAV